MKTTKQQRQSLYDEYIGLYRSALEASSEFRTELERNMRQFLGSNEIDNSTESAITVRNITYELLESQVDPDVPYPKAGSAVYSEDGERLSGIIERLCLSVKDKLPFESLNDLDERYTYVYGGSVWYVEWDNTIAGGGGVRIHCLSPLDFVAEPGVYSVENMKYCFLRFTTTKSELKSRWGATDEELERAECEYHYKEQCTDSDTVTVINCLYRDEDGDICKLIFSGSVVLSDVPKMDKRRNEDGEYLDTELIRDPSLSDGGLLAVPYFTPKSLPLVIRQNTRVAPTLLGLSDCERIRPQQQAINKVESRILKKLLRAGVTPVMPEDASITLGNSVFGELIRMRPGESIDNYGKIDTTPDVSKDIAEADRLYDHAKRVLGISDALQGLDNVQNESGFARQLKITRATSRLQTKRRMKYHAYSALYRIIFEHYLAFADEPRPLNYKDGLGKGRESCFNRHEFIRRDPDGRLYYCDDFIFSVDLNGGDEYSREVLWQRNLSNLESGTLGDISSPSTLLRYWQSQERAHYPFARENVEYFEQLVQKENESASPTRKD